MSRFARRSPESEIMDDLTCEGEVVCQTLKELEIINQWLGGNAVTLEAVSFLAKQNRSETISIADLGCGSGEMLKRIAIWGRKNNFRFALRGIDANKNIIEFAKVNCRDYPEITFETIDIFSPSFKDQRFDIVMGTLFYHHFTDDGLIKFFSILKDQVRTGIIINDIHRHWLAYYSIRILTQILSKSSMVKFDAPLSVLRAFRKHELETILQKAGIHSYQLRWKWAFRWQVICFT